VVFQGDKGMIRLDGGPFNANVNDLAAAQLHRAGHSVCTERFPAANQYVLQVEAFAKAVQGGAAQGGAGYFPSLEFVRGTQAMMDAVYGCAVEIAL
jgi:predicted dehydrogenase